MSESISQDAKPSSAEVQFTLTERLQRAIKECTKQENISQLNSKQKDTLKQLHSIIDQSNDEKTATNDNQDEPLDKAPPYEDNKVDSATKKYKSATTVPIPISLINELSQIYRQLHPHADDCTDSKLNCGFGFVHELIKDSKLYSEPIKTSRQTAEFKAFLARMRVVSERREYYGLVKDLPGNSVLRQSLTAVQSQDPDAAAIASSQDDSSNSFASQYKSASREMGVGINILTLMFTGFVVFWYAGQQMFRYHPTYDKIGPVFCGLVGLIGALLLEVTLFMLRESKAEIKQKQSTRSHQQLLVQRQQIEQQRRLDKRHKQLDELQKSMEVEKQKQQHQQENIASQNSQATSDAADAG
jgi:hypothetical protein